MNELERYATAIQNLCEKHRVKHLYAFGSILTDRFNDESDVDLIVAFESEDPEGYADNYFELKFALEDLFNRKIDLLEEQAIRNPYFLQAILDKRRLVYGH